MLMNYRIKDGQIAVVPNGFDAQGIREKSSLPLPPVVEGLIRGHSPALMSVGRIAPMKGQHILVEAVKRLRIEFPSMVCLIVGRRGGAESMEDIDSYFKDLMGQIHRYRLENCVHLLGEVDYVPELLHHADVYVHPSFTESFSRVVGEALICGKPVVCTNAGALPEVVGPQGAIMVEPGDAEGLAQGIKKVLQGESLRQSIVSFGQKHVESHYSVLQTAPRFLEVLLSVSSCRLGGRRVGNVF
jgi:glycosyltransferase involved in cell wall biosynthesis